MLKEANEQHFNTIGIIQEAQACTGWWNVKYDQN